jgi:nucleoside-diphosphate-sugar epimerase
MLSALISTHMLMTARETAVERLFYSSSACVYAADKQTSTEVMPARESDSYPGMPEDGYGWEKLFSARMCRYFREEYGLATRAARYHNLYGRTGPSTVAGERRRPSSAEGHRRHLSARTIEIWGDGQQTRSFMYIDNCIKGTQLIFDSDETEPLNLGSDRLVTINELVDIVEAIAA